MRTSAHSGHTDTPHGCMLRSIHIHNSTDNLSPSPIPETVYNRGSVRPSGSAGHGPRTQLEMLALFAEPRGLARACDRSTSRTLWCLERRPRRREQRRLAGSGKPARELRPAASHAEPCRTRDAGAARPVERLQHRDSPRSAEIFDISRDCPRSAESARGGPNARWCACSTLGFASSCRWRRLLRQKPCASHTRLRNAGQQVSPAHHA